MAQPPSDDKATLAMILEKLDLVATILLDGLILLVAILTRAGLLWVVARFSPREPHSWVLTALEWILDVGLVGTAVVHVVFDLAKRIRNSYRNFRGAAP